MGVYHDYDMMANREIKQEFKCIVCGETLRCRWSDYHGEGVCLTCGTPYQLIHYDENKKRVNKEPRINIKPGYIPKLLVMPDKAGPRLGVSRGEKGGMRGCG